jgi:hypothetical protein
MDNRHFLPVDGDGFGQVQQMSEIDEIAGFVLCADDAPESQNYGQQE